MSEFLKGLKPLIPYVIIITLILVAYGFLLDAYLDEFSAPFILPIMLFAVLVYERLTQEKGILKRENLNIDYVEKRLEKSWDDVRKGNESLEKTVREEIGRASCRERV